MKLKIFSLLLALGAAWSLQSCDNNDDESIKVPAQLQNAFSEKYPNVANVRWESKAGYYVADFRDGYEASAWFAPNGEWQMTETDVPFDALPQAVKTEFGKSEYKSDPGWNVDDVDKLERKGLETVYVIEVERQNEERDLYYSEEGVLIKTVVDVDDRDDQYLPEQNAQLTESMKTFINTQYPGYRLMGVDIEDDGAYRGFTEVDIIHFDTELSRNVSKEILFDKAGAWHSTSWDVRRNELPRDVEITLSAQITANSGYHFDDAERIEEAAGNAKYYRIELEKDNSQDIILKISDDGTLLQ